MEFVGNTRCLSVFGYFGLFRHLGASIMHLSAPHHGQTIGDCYVFDYSLKLAHCPLESNAR